MALTTFQPPTKQDIREISVGLSTFCTEEKSQSISNANTPSKNNTMNRQRKIVRARRGSQRQHQNRNGNGNVNAHNYNNNNDKKFAQMTDSQYMEYQKQTQQHRMKRKRKFDVFSSGSNESLQEILEQPKTFRVPYHSFFYVRVDNQNNSQLQQILNTNTNNNQNNTNRNTENEMKTNSNNSNNKNKTKNAFEMMTKASKAINDWNIIEAKLNDNNNDLDDDNDTNMGQNDDDEEVEQYKSGTVFYPIREECLITRSVRVSSEWVTAFDEYEAANNIAWKEFNSDGKIHEYQINLNSGIMLLNLDETIKTKDININGDMVQFLNENEKEIKQWALDHGFSGFICNSCYYLFQPHLYWNLLDDNKRSKVKQTLISDMFQSAKTKPANNAWKSWKATF